MVTLPDVKVVFEAAMPLIPVCAPPMFAPETVIVAPAVLVDCERVMLFPPAQTTLVPVMPVFPEVFPIVERPAEKSPAVPGPRIEIVEPAVEVEMPDAPTIALVAGALIVIDSEPALVDQESVMF